MIELGCELKALQSIHINPENFVETTLVVDEEEIKESHGKDSFSLAAAVIPGHRFSATGRLAAYNLESLPGGLGVFEARGCKKVAIPEGKELKLKLKSNFLLDYNRLSHQLSLFLLFNSRQHEIDLRRPDIGIHWIRRGEFIIDLTSAAQRVMS